MKKPCLVLAWVFLSLSGSAQQKSITPLPAAASAKAGAATYAVVVGISDYQDKDIPDLRFADKDAEAFANFLRSPAGGSLDGDHLKLLTNQEATLGQVTAAFYWLMEVAHEGENVLIYFSGHGDVESRRISQPGYLLGWDAPSGNYMAGGAINVRDFQDVISTLSVQNKAKVVVITDACHSGKLSGSEINGAQLTGQNLARQYANEVKILSCQPNEYSIEGEQWGGGRGAFSFNLVDALYGLADGNNDLFVTLQEVGRYLEDHVSAEVAPVSQVPMVIGNRSERLASVDSKLLADLRSGKINQMLMLSPVSSRGMEDEVLAGVDTTTRELYRLFKQALKDKVFLEPATACADAYYTRLMAEPKMQRLHSTMTRNYAAALQDDAQQTLNEWLKTRQEVSLGATANARLPEKMFTEKVRTYPRCLDRAAELLGNKHYMYAALKARKYFFEGYLLANSNQNTNTELGGQALALFRQSLEWQPEQPQVYWQMSKVFGYNFRQPDSLEHYARRALEVYPNWTVPCLEAAFWLSDRYKQPDRARPFLEQARRIDSSSAEVLQILAVFYFNEKNYGESERQLLKAISLDSTDAYFWTNLGMVYLNARRYTEAEQHFKKAIALDSTSAGTWDILGNLYLSTRRYADAESVIKKAIELDSTESSAWNNLGNLYFSTRRYAEAEPVLKKAIALDSTESSAWNNLGSLYLSTRRYAEAEPVLKKAVALDSTNTTAWSNLGGLYLNTRRYAEAEQQYKKAIALDSTFVIAWNSLGLIYLKTGHYAEAEPVLKKAIAIDSTYAGAHLNLGTYYFKTHRLEEARRQFLNTIALNPNAQSARLGMAYLLASEGKTTEAIGYVEQAIGKGATLELLESDVDLAPLRALPDWEALMKRYFADQIYYNLACAQSLKGELDKAFESLEQSLNNGWKDYDWMQQDTDLAALRERAERWGELMKKYFPDKVKD